MKAKIHVFPSSAIIPATGLAMLLALGTARTAGAATIYLDPNIASASCSNYSVATRSCGGGTDVAYKAFASASAATRPGDTVIVRGGTFTTPFNAAVSGDNTAGAYITYRAYDKVNEPVTITSTGYTPALLIENKSGIVMDGFNISSVYFWAEIIDGYSNIIRNCSFDKALDTGTRSGLKIVRGAYNKVTNNTFNDGNDELVLENTNRNVVEGNRFTLARHTLTNISCSNFNIIRNNYYNNTTQKIGEEFDCEGAVSSTYHDDKQVQLYNATKHNIWEKNTFAFTKDNADHGGPYNAIQYAGQNGLVRFNIFYNNQGGAVELTEYSSEANHCYGARVFHNVFYNNIGGGVPTNNKGASSAAFWDNRMVNNIIFNNQPMPLAWNSFALGGSQASHRSTASGGFKFEYNDILAQSPGDGNIIYFNSAGFYSLQGAQASYPQFYANNIEVNPGFVDAPNHDFHLQSNSQVIDRGTFLTRTRSAGSGTSLPLTDVTYFFDGYGIPLETGDLIQLEGQGQATAVVGIDYANNVLTLAQPLNWALNQGVSLAYKGTAPDMGAFESGGTTPPARTPNPPTNLQVH